MSKRDSPADSSVIVLWMRRDLRIADNPALLAAAETGAPVIPVYVLDDDTPGMWRMGGASRWWLAQSLRSLGRDLGERGSRLILRRGRADVVLTALVKETGAGAVYFTRGYEPYHRALEASLRRSLEDAGAKCKRFGGQLLIEPERHLNKSGEPFRVFTPFYKALVAADAVAHPVPAPAALTGPATWPASDSLESLELEPTKPDWAGGLRNTWSVGEAAAAHRLDLFIESMLGAYGRERDKPGTDGTSRLSPSLAFGEIGPRQIWHAVLSAAQASGHRDLGEAYLREIVWREFSYHLLFHFPHLPERAFKPEFDRFPWRPEARGLKAWKEGRTGYPIVDAGMRQLWQTGWMHNRVRMIAASFLVKHLLVPWQTGEAWFWDTLVDADLASNSASWQWVAGSGADAAPYFRIFNPVLQGEKFDPEGGYVRRFCPELAKLPAAVIHRPWQADPSVLRAGGVTLGVDYPKPVVDHTEARQQAMAAYSEIKTSKSA